MSKSASKRARAAGLLSWTLVAWIGPAARAAAQEPVVREPSLEQFNASLRERDRARLHPGDALKISGLEQGDNDLRSRTPALARSNRSVRLIDPHAARERALALHADRATFGQPPPSLSRSATPRAPGRAPTAGNAGPQPAAAPGPKQELWVFGLGLFALLIAWVRSRCARPAPKHPAIVVALRRRIEREPAILEVREV